MQTAVVRAPTVVFSPPDVAGLYVWLKADAITGLVDGDPVGTWPDSSGGGRDATQATAAKRPTYKAAILNGRPVVRFDGVDDGVANATWTRPDIPYTVFVVYQSSDAAGHILGMQRAGGARTEGIRKSAAGTLHLVQQNGSTTTLDISGPAAGADWHIASYVLSGSNASFSGELRRSGTLIAGPTTATAARDVNAAGRILAIGETEGADVLGGDIAEILVYSQALSAADHNGVGQHLRDKYALTWTDL